ncbi:MAG: helix-turn-helix domain-containing protein, partial [Propionibacteriaceae bacterium]|jgi:excisionase family DNA binding protein|nr:helix-turn-helix domain-containing protein [Propionibacteriaceae bacterium]
VLSPPADPGVLAEFEDIVAKASPTPAIREAFTSAVHALASGSAVRIESIPKMLSTSQAAEILNISRTTMVKLLEDGKLPYEQPNVHRLVRLEDVLAYKQQRTAKRRTFLRDLTRDSIADGTYFMTAAEADAAFAQERNQ